MPFCRFCRVVAHIGFCSDVYSYKYTFVCVEILRPSQPNGIMSCAVNLPNYTFTGQA